MQLEKIGSLSWIYQLSLINHSNLTAPEGVPVEQRLLEHMVDGFEGENGSLALFESDDPAHLRIVAGTGLPPGVLGSKVQAGEGVIGCAIRENTPLLLCGDASADPRFAKYRSRDRGPVAGSAMCFPLRVLGRIIGTLSVSRGAALPPYAPDNLESGTVVVSLISLVIENTRLQQEQRARIAALLESEARFQATFDQAAAGVSIQDLDGRYLAVNKALCGMLGYTKAELRQLRFPQLTHPEDRERNGELRRQLLSGEIDRYSLEKRFIKKDGTPVWTRSSVSLVRGAQGGRSYAVGVIVDISEHKRAEEAVRLSNVELRKTNEQLQATQHQLLQSEKMASIGQLAAGVAHEINNPIGYVSSNLDTLAKYLRDLFALFAAYESAESALPEGVAGELRDLRQSVDLEFLRTDIDALVSESREGILRVTKIVKDLKDFSHTANAEEWQLADLHEGLESTLNIVRNEIKYKCEVLKEYGELPRIECLPSQLNQVFMNLLVNAGQAIEERGTITLRTGAADGHVWVEIEDTGKGIAAEHIAKIFDPFFTTKPVGKGTGLGLSLSYGIAQKHGGRIEVSSTPGRGSSFRVWLPQRQRAPAASARAQFEAAGA